MNSLSDLIVGRSTARVSSDSIGKTRLFSSSSMSPTMSVREAILSSTMDRNLLSRYSSVTPLVGLPTSLSRPASLLDGNGAATTEDYLRDILSLPPVLIETLPRLLGGRLAPKPSPTSDTMLQIEVALERRRLETECVQALREQVLALTEDSPFLPSYAGCGPHVFHDEHQALTVQPRNVSLTELNPEGTLEALGRSMKKKDAPYIDASNMAEPTPKELVQSRRTRGGVTEPFPEKLHRMLQEVEEAGNADIVSFFPHGRAFAVHNQERFIKEIMPKYFKQSRLSSFNRQLNLYGFTRITTGQDIGGYYHELFLKGRPSLCIHMRRVGIPQASEDRRRNKAILSRQNEPNFYAMQAVSR